MKKYFLIAGLLVIAILAVTLALADTFSIGSDDIVEWSADGITWYPVYETWIHPAWPTIDGASWIWRTNQTNPQEEYNSVPEGGWYFRKTFEIPECVDEENLQGIITAAADNSYQMYFNRNYIDGRGTMNKDGPDAQSWRLKTSANLSGLVSGENEILFRALNYFNTGSYSSNPAGLIFQIQIEMTGDSDNDNLDDCTQDLCLDTEEDVLLEELETNRWIWNGGDWITKNPNGKGPQKDFTIEQTKGCSCIQILEYLHENYPEEYGEMQGHYKFGCSQSVMQDFINLI
jgi:hypothetical protein